MAEECKSCQAAQANSFTKGRGESSNEHHHDHHDHGGGAEGIDAWKLPLLASVPLLLGIVIDFTAPHWWGVAYLRILVYVIAFLPVALPVFKEAWELMWHDRDFFNECSLMSVAAIGAFAIGEYPEAVMIMLLYTIGEIFEGKAVAKAKRSIAELVDSREELVTKLLPSGETVAVLAEEVQPGDHLRVVAGERLSLDTTLLSKDGVVDLSALTGESTPEYKTTGDTLLAGSVVLNQPIEVEVLRPYEESTLARVIAMAEEAADRKPPTERFIRKFAHIYTPIVTGIAALVVLLPYLWSLLSPSFTYEFADWFYRSLVFLVTSCPCALVISVPLGYFSGIGAASRHGLLFKGVHFLEKKATAVVFDKTGTLTEGKFSVTNLLYESEDALAYLIAMERQSSHPIAFAIVDHLGRMTLPQVTLHEVEEIAGHGLKATNERGETILCGNDRLLVQYHILLPERYRGLRGTVVYVAVGEEVVAAVALKDQIKLTSKKTIEALRQRGLSNLVMLSGDRQEIVTEVGREIGLDAAHGGLLPQDKMTHVAALMERETVIFVGDGLNDAPVMSMSDIGVAMGGIASDITIEAADIVIQGDNPYKLVEAIDIGRRTNQIVYQNIIFALGFKFTVVLLAIFGIASLPLAVMADVGVTLLAILNSMRLLRYSPPR